MHSRASGIFSTDDHIWVFSTADHSWEVEGERQDSKKYRDAANDVKLQEIVSNQGAFEKRLFLRAKHMGAWLIVLGTTVTGTAFSATEFCGFCVIITTLTPLTS